MTLPQTPVAAGGQGGHRLGRSAWALLVVLALCVASAVAPAQTPAQTPEADPFSATVPVDATAATVVQARETARLDGQRRALAAVVAQLSGDTGAAKLPKLDDQAITDLVASFEVANERMSTVRYVADYTFHFHKMAVQRLLAKAGIAQAAPGAPGAPGDEGGKPVVVLPVYQSGGQLRLWDDPNPWRDAWGQTPPAPGAVHLLLPLGNAGDLAAIDAEKANAADPGALAAIARRNGGDDAIVALAAIRPQGGPAAVDVTVRRYHDGQLVDTHAAPLDSNPGESPGDLLRRAVAAVAGQIESGWQNAPVPGYDQQGSLTAILPIAGLDDWVQAKRRLAAVPVVRKIALMALSRQEATIEIGYAGTIDQLKAGLAGISLSLVHDDSLWRLARTGPGGAP